MDSLEKKMLSRRVSGNGFFFPVIRRVVERDEGLGKVRKRKERLGKVRTGEE